MSMRPERPALKPAFLMGIGFELAPMNRERLLIGLTIALLCGVGAAKVRWLVGETPKGRWLAGRLGEPRARRVLRALLAAGAAFGTLLAAGVVRPVEW